MSGKLAMDDMGSDDEASQQSGGGSSHRSFKSQLDKALTARQEAEVHGQNFSIETSRVLRP